MTTGVVIGAAGGIGRACVRALAGSAELMILSGRRREPLEEVACEVAGQTAVVAADVATAEGRDEIVSAIDGPLVWLVLASGVPLRKPLSELDEGQITATFATNLVGPTLLLRSLVQLRWQAPATVVVVGSIAASRSLPQRSVYGASKAGLEHLARSLAGELAPSGIRVNVVAPGVIETPFLGKDRAALAEWVDARVPVARLGSPDEVASVVRYLVLEAPAYLTGARITVDGGAETVA